MSVLQKSEEKAICNECLLFTTWRFENLADDTIRCPMCTHTDGVVVQYTGPAELTFLAKGKDEFERRIYVLDQVDGTFNELSKMVSCKCPNCESRIPNWIVEVNDYVRIARTKKTT